MSTKEQYYEGQEVTVKINGVPVQAIYRGWSTDYNLAIVEVNGRRFYRKIQVQRSGGSSTSVEAKPSRFSIGQRFEFIENVVDMVVIGDSKSVIISGSGGLGKTFTVLRCLRQVGLEEETDYEIVKGFTTPKSLYRLLWRNRKRIVVFDDCDSVWDNPTSVSILKAALDSYETRRLSWLSEGFRNEDDDLPQTFEFEGKIIFVSNQSLAELDQAVLSRCLFVDVSMTAAEKIDRIRSLVPEIRKDMTMESKLEVVDELERLRDQIGDLNIRTFLKGCDIRHRASDNWQELLEYVVTAL